MKNSKKLVSLALCLTLVFSMFACLGAFTASAATEASGKRDLDWDGTYWYSDTKVSTYTSGTGTAVDPYIVTTAAQLRHLARGNGSGGGKYYKLGNDIVLNDTSAEDWYEQDGLTNWIKGTDSAYGVFSEARNRRELGGELFRDTFDGDGHTISGLYIDYNGTGKMSDRTIANWALFPAVNGATFKNLKLKDVYIKSNVSSSNNEWHGYGALIGSTYYGGATVTNVEIENVKFDVKRPNQGTGNSARVCIGAIIGYAAGNITATDCIVRNVSANIGNYYFTSRMYGHAGSLLGFVVDGYKHTLTNVLSIGAMNPLSVQAADSAVTIQSGNYPSNMPLRANSSATNVWAIGAGSILSGSNINRSADTAAFLSNDLSTFYSSLGGSTNWAAQQAGVLPSLSDFPYVEEHKTPAAVIHCDFSDYSPNTAAKALTNWTVATESGNKVLKGDFTNTSLVANNFGFIVGSYNYGVHGPMVPGKIYKLEFKAKADQNASMDYAVYNGSTYAASSRDYHLVSGGYDAFGRRTAHLTTEWQKYTTYFTFDSYTNTIDASNGTKRPFFFVQPNNTIWNNSVYFDDFAITPYEGTSFAASANHYYEPTLGYNGDDVTLIADPEKADYVFKGWYTDAEGNDPFDADTVKVSDGLILYEGWEEAVTEMEFDAIAVDESGTGTYSENLYARVTSSNAYPINLEIVNDGEDVVLGFATASEDDFDTAKNVIWQKTIPAGSGTVSLLLEPNTVKEDGVRGDTLYLFVRYANGAEISIDNFAMINAPTSRTVEFDVNADNELDILDLLRLKKMSLLTADLNWLGDLDDDGFAAQSSDLVAVRKALLGISEVVTAKRGRTLVWNEEFDSTAINSTNLQVKYPDDKSLIVSNSEDNYNYHDGKLNLNITRSGSTYKIPYDVVSRNKMSFKYGYIEISAKMSFTPGQWSAFWLSGIQDENTYQGEIDVFETVGTGVKPDMHSWDNGTRITHLAGVASTYVLPANFDKTAYHTYGFEWDSDYLKFYVDDYCYYTLAAADVYADEDNSFDGVLDQYYYLLLSNSTLTEAMSADNALPRMSIDYVRLYQKDGELLTVGS